MGSSIAFYCTDSDTLKLSEYAMSIGLFQVAPIVDQKITRNASDGPFIYLSALPTAELSPYGDPPINVSDATDPLMGFMRAYLRREYLVLGHIYLSNDVPELHKITKPYYGKLCKWIKANWKKVGDFYIGENAQQAIKSGAKKVNFYPETIAGLSSTASITRI